MKKFITIFLALALVLSLAACGSSSEDETDPAGPNGPMAPPQPGETLPEPGTPVTPLEPGEVPGDSGLTPTESTAPTPLDPSEPVEPSEPAEPSEPSEPSEPVEPSEPGEGSDTPSIVPGFPGIAMPGQGGGEDIPVTDAGDLVDTLDALCKDNVTDPNFTESLRSSDSFANYFGGRVQYAEGMRVAVNHLEMAPPAHVAMLIEVPEGMDAEEYAGELEANAEPRWLICAAAESVKVSVKDGLILVVMSSEEIADAVTDAFNG